MNYQEEQKIDKLINEANELGLNHIGFNIDFSTKRDILNTSKYECKLNNSLLKDGFNDPVTRMELKHDGELKWFKVRPSKDKNTNYFIKINIIKELYMNWDDAQTFINN